MIQSLLASRTSYHVGVVPAPLYLLNLSCTTTRAVPILDSAVIMINTLFELSAGTLNEKLDHLFGEGHSILDGRIPMTSWREGLVFLPTRDDSTHVLQVMLREQQLLANYEEAVFQVCPKRMRNMHAVFYLSRCPKASLIS